MINRLLQVIRPYARSIKYGRLLKRAMKDASNQKATALITPVGFVLGCGRSGTTILGKLLTAHPQVHYLREPYHIWRAIDPATDMVRLFGDSGVQPRCIMDENDATETVIQKFQSCMYAEQRRGGSNKRVIEKTPIQSMRIQLLRRCSPQSPMLHVVRNGLDVIRSIDRLAKDTAFGTAGKGNWNRWWGRDNCKWHALAKDAVEYHWFKEEVPTLTTDVEMGALEWIISVGSIQKSREELGSQLLEIRYNTLTESPKESLKLICNHFSLDPCESWIAHCCNQLDAARKNDGVPLELPPQMCEAFNKLQVLYGFEGLAIPKTN